MNSEQEYAQAWEQANAVRRPVDEQQKAQALEDAGLVASLRAADAPVQEVITQRDVFENVMPWGGMKQKLISAALGTLFDATYGYNTKDYNNLDSVGPGQSLARAIADFAPARTTPVVWARTLYPGFQQYVTDALIGE